MPMRVWRRDLEDHELISVYKGSIHGEAGLGNVTLQLGYMFVLSKGIAHRSLLPADPEEENMIVELKFRGEISKLN